MFLNFDEALGFKPKASSFSLLCDYETLLEKDISLKSFISLCKNKDIKLIQYKDNISSLEIQKENLKIFKNSLNIPVMINNKLELAEYCDGLHFEQKDFSLIHKDKKIATKLIRKRIGKKLLGLSVSNEIEILEANELELDMIEIGKCNKYSANDIDNIGNKISYLQKISFHPLFILSRI